MKTTWQIEYEEAEKQANIYIGGQEDINNSYRQQLITMLLESYGQTKLAALLVSPSIPNFNYPNPDALLIHPETGVVAFRIRQLSIGSLSRVSDELLLIDNGRTTDINFSEEMDNLRIDIESAIKKIRVLKKKKMPVISLTIFPEISLVEWEESGLAEEKLDDGLLFSDDIETPTVLQERIAYLLSGRSIEQFNKDILVNLIKKFGDNAVLDDEIHPRSIPVPDDSPGAVIDKLKARQKQLSREQQDLSRMEIGISPRLIRGVAGSGKTVVLANQIARYLTRRHQQGLFKEDTPLRIAVICFNRSLVAMLQQKISQVYEQNTGQTLKSEHVIITHYNNLLWRIKDTLPYLKLGNYPNGNEGTVQRAKDYLNAIEKLKTVNSSAYESLLFDAIFIDEGQDFESEEYQFISELVRTHPETQEKPLIIFYDDAQNLYARTRPNWKQIGINVSGGRSSVMKKCFRNTRPIVEMAFNVLVGKKSQTSSGVRTFADVNYLKQNELVEETDDHITVKFTSRSGQPPISRRFATRDAEKAWVVNKIIEIIYEQHVRPEDILILFHKTYAYNDLPSLFRAADTDNLIEGYIQPYGSSGKKHQDMYILQPNHLTLSTTFGAKGYDSWFVFLLGVDQFEDQPEDRASFYVGATRAKLGLYLTGLDRNNILLSEAQRAIQDMQLSD